MARFIQLSSEDDKETYFVNVEAIAAIRIKKGASPENTIVLVGGEKLKAQTLGDKAMELREAMGLKAWGKWQLIMAKYVITNHIHS